MAYKLIFRFDRSRYQDTLIEPNQQISNELTAIFNELRIECSRFYKPSRDSIKTLLPTEKQVNKVLTESRHFNAAGFEPTLTMALKAARTVYCYGFDPALVNTYTTQDIKDHLTQAN